MFRHLRLHLWLYSVVRSGIHGGVSKHGALYLPRSTFGNKSRGDVLTTYTTRRSTQIAILTF